MPKRHRCRIGANMRSAVLVASVLLSFSRPIAQEPAAGCAGLASRAPTNTAVTLAQEISEGSFALPRQPGALRNLPPFCRIAGVIAPTSDSEIRFEVWMPLTGWNGKFAGVGNGGWAGDISYVALAEQLRRGYAAASTNTGHEDGAGLDMARFAHDKPERLIDFAYRAHHETAVAAKSLVQAFYGKASEHAYFIGCSSGGYEGLMEAQRFPTDYEGIVAGAPANNWTRLMAGDFDGVLAVLKDPASTLPPSALGMLYRSVLASCDAIDGVVDGVIDDPRRCTFDPATLSCSRPHDGVACLTEPQVGAARRIYGGLKDPVSGAQLYPGLARGSEPFWPHRDAANPFQIPLSHYRWLVFADPNWDWKTFDWMRPSDYEAHQKAEARLAPILNATNPDLKEFRRRGGKLLQYHGWNDQLIAAENSINYYESVQKFFGSAAEVQSFYRLFMVPGMTHCAGGTGPNAFDMQPLLEQWVERGVPPDRVIATRSINGVVDRSRPLCVYPRAAVYTGKGDTNEAASFVCKDPPR